MSSKLPSSMMRSAERIMAIRNMMTPRRRTVAMNSSPQVSTYCCCHVSKVALKSASCSAVK